MGIFINSLLVNLKQKVQIKIQDLKEDCVIFSDEDSEEEEDDDEEEEDDDDDEDDSDSGEESPEENKGYFVKFSRK